MQNSPFVFFKGTPSEYLEILNETYRVIKESDAKAKVLHGGMSGMHDAALAFWGSVFELGGAKYFDIANIHSKGGYIFDVPRFRALLTKYNIIKPIWVTEASVDSAQENISKTDKANILVKAYAMAFVDADKIFYTAHTPEGSEQAINDKETFTALKTIIRKLDLFNYAVKISDTSVKFVFDDRIAYVIWGKVPPLSHKKILVTFPDGNFNIIDLSELNLSDKPVIVEPIE